MYTLLPLLTALATPSWADDGLDPGTWSAEPSTRKAGTKNKAKSKPNAARDKNTAKKSTEKAKAKSGAEAKPIGVHHDRPAGGGDAKPASAGGNAKPASGGGHDVTNRPKQPPPATRAASPKQVHATARVNPARRPHPDVKVKIDVHAGPMYRSRDHRWARPNPFVVIVHPRHPPPHYVWYRPRWTHWWVHPYWRWTHATGVVVAFSYAPDPWTALWVPPQPRTGWVWVDGYWASANVWVPGNWAPVQKDPMWMNQSWVWVPGWWMGNTWVDGYWRLSKRPGWVWADGYYLDDGEYVRGWWQPAGPPPQSDYVWEAGFWDGQYWVEGYWRPKTRAGFEWVDSWLDDSGIYHTGYWEPVEDRAGMMWIPGWFDGEQWTEGEWVSQADYDKADPEDWQPDEGWDQQSDKAVQPDSDEPPPALPFDGPPS
jgi:hypothetical protein